MLGVDVAVWLAILLSLASAMLCVVYGLARWNADDDGPPESQAGPPDTSGRNLGGSRREEG